MNISMDGLRKNATFSMNELYQTITNIIDEDNICDCEKEELIESFNQAAQFVDTFNCIYDDDVEGDFNELDIDIKRLEEKKNV